MANKTLGFELKINGVKAELDNLERLTNELNDVTQAIKLFKKEGENFGHLIAEQKKLKIAINDVNRAINSKNKEFDKQFRQGDTLANKQRQWQQAAREMYRQEQQDIKTKSALRKKDVQEAVNANEIEKRSVIGMRLELVKLKKEYYALSEVERNSRSGQMLNRRIATQNAEVMGIERSVGVHSRNVGNYPQAMGMVASSMTGGLIGSGPAAGYAALAALVVGVVKQTISLNAEIDGLQANVRKTTNLNAESVERLTERLRRLDTSTTLQDLIKISVEAGRFGVQGEKAVGDFTEAINVLNIALGDEFGGGVEQITTEVAQLSNVLYGVSNDGTVMADRFQKIGNTLNVLANAGSATAGQISDIASRIGGIGKAIGFTDSEILGISSAIQEMGISAERGGTAFATLNSKMRSNLAGFAQATGIAQDELKKLLDTRPIEAMNTVITKLYEKANGSPTELLGFLKDLKISGAGVSEIFFKWAQNQDLVNDRLNQSAGAIGNINSLLKEQENMMDSIPGQWGRLKNAFSDFFVSSGFQNKVKGLLADVSDFLSAASALNNGKITWSQLFDVTTGDRTTRAQRLKNAIGVDLADVQRARGNRTYTSPDGRRYKISNGERVYESNSIPEKPDTGTNNTTTNTTISKAKKEIEAAAGSVDYFEKKIKDVEELLSKTSNAALIQSLKAKLTQLNEELAKAKYLISDGPEQRARNQELGDLPVLQSKGGTAEEGISSLLGIVDKKNQKDIIDAAEEITDQIGEKTQRAADESQQKTLNDLINKEQLKRDFILENTQYTVDAVFDIWRNMEERKTQESIERLDLEYSHKLDRVKGNATLEAALIKELEDKKIAIEKESRRKSKQMALAQAAINGALAVTNIWANTVDVTPVQGFKIAATIAALAQTALQIGVISSQSFARGGFTGKSNSLPDATGERPVGIVHEDEFVFDKNTTRRYRPLFEAIHTGRVPTFAQGGYTTPIPQLITAAEMMRPALSESDMQKFAYIVAAETKVAILEGTILAGEEGTRMRERKQSQLNNSVK